VCARRKNSKPLKNIYATLTAVALSLITEQTTEGGPPDRRQRRPPTN